MTLQVEYSFVNSFMNLVSQSFLKLDEIVCSRDNNEKLFTDFMIESTRSLHCTRVLISLQVHDIIFQNHQADQPRMVIIVGNDINSLVPFDFPEMSFQQISTWSWLILSSWVVLC